MLLVNRVLEMDPAFLFAGVRLDKKRFTSDLNRFKVLVATFLQGVQIFFE